MRIAAKEKIVVLGMMSKLRVAGGIWQNVHYLVGLQRLGYDVYYVEAHGCLTWAFKDNELEAAAFIDSVMRRFDMGDRWSFHARSGSGRYYGMSEQQVRNVCSEAAAVLNLHGGTVPAPEHLASKRLVFIDTDPTAVQIEIHHDDSLAIGLLEPHCAFFTFGENYGQADCRLPVSERFRFKPTRQPVVLDLWEQEAGGDTSTITTIGNWQQLRRVVVFEGEEYLWSKHFEFLKFLDLPRRTSQHFALALSSYDDSARILLEENGWEILEASAFSLELDPYRQFICDSRGEFTVAKDQNVRLRTGWFSDRSATYLAAGRPVITQETGFSAILPVGEGLFAFSTMEEILAAVDEINGDYGRHRRAAREVAREYFAHDVVLTRLLSDLGISHHSRRATKASPLVVNVLANLRDGTGMATTARRYARALETTGARVNLADFTDSPAALMAEQGETVNIVCSDIASQSVVLSRMKDDVFRRGYNIGLWLWELAAVPREWHDRFAYYDEIWAPTSFLASAFSPVSPVPVVTMPHVLEPESYGDRQRGRARLGLEPDEFTFAFIFSFHSRVERKNPLAVIESFRAAFSPADPARLILKCSHPDFNREYFAEMKKRAVDCRISLYTGEWTSEEIADLTAACDCYVSLHRAEGVGLTISDAMAAGKPVIATGWSGNMDFMNVSNSFPVRYRMVTLDRDVAHYRAGNVWAEPSIEHAAELMQYVFSNRAEADERGRLAQQEIAEHYSNRALTEVFRSRLSVIQQRQNFSLLQQRLRQPNADSRTVAEEFSSLKEYLPEHHLRYHELKQNLRRVIQENIPPAERVMVVSKGDEELLDLGGRPAWHFPDGGDGKYAGHHPRDCSEAICKLEESRARGGKFLIFPETSMWWLEHYPGFRDHLKQNYSVAYADEFCTVFGLSPVQRPVMQEASKERP